jgi:galactoside O-acetyltransferase
LANIAYDLGLARVGRDVTIWSLAKIVNPECICIGDSVIIDDFVFLSGREKTLIGSFNHIASFVSITGGGEFIMEDFAGISSGTRVFTGNDDYLGGCMTGPTVPYPYRIPIRSSVRIGRHAVVGANSVILPGVRLGEGAVIGANSLVTKDCDPWTVYFGSPARPHKPRPKETILELEARLRREMYDAEGRYIPRQGKAAPGGDENPR